MKKYPIEVVEAIYHEQVALRKLIGNMKLINDGCMQLRGSLHVLQKMLLNEEAKF